MMTADGKIVAASQVSREQVEEWEAKLLELENKIAFYDAEKFKHDKMAEICQLEQRRILEKIQSCTDLKPHEKEKLATLKTIDEKVQFLVSCHPE